MFLINKNGHPIKIDNQLSYSANLWLIFSNSNCLHRPKESKPIIEGEVSNIIMLSLALEFKKLLLSKQNRKL